MKLEEILTSLDCSQLESSIFSALLSYPNGASVVTLGKKLALPRPTLYGNIEKLMDKGLVKKGLRNEGGIFFVESKGMIARIYDEKIKTLGKAKIELHEVLSQILPNTISYKPRFVIYEGTDAYQSVFGDILRSGEKETFWIWPLGEMLKHIPEKAFFDFHTERAKNGMWLNVLWPQKKKMDLEKHPLLFSKKEDRALRRIKLLPKQIDQTMGYGIYGNKVAFLSSERENYAFVIESKELSSTLKSHFDFLWSISKKYSE